jgi:hypothetical protein
MRKKQITAYLESEEFKKGKGITLQEVPCVKEGHTTTGILVFEAKTGKYFFKNQYLGIPMTLDEVVEYTWKRRSHIGEKDKAKMLRRFIE